MGTLVYRYGLLAPTSRAEEVMAQMRAAHRYRNTLVEIERGRRAAVRAVLSVDLGPLEKAAEAAQAELSAALLAVRTARKETRSRSDTTAMRLRVTAAREAKRVALRAFRVRKAEMREGGSHRGEIGRIEERATELRKSARHYCGVYWGSYLLVEDADQASRKTPLYDGTEPNDPRFLRFAGAGHVGVQLQGGMAAADAFGEGTLLRIGHVDERAWHSESRGERRRLARTTLTLRIGSKNSAPVWATWPMLMHRPLPEGSILKRATVSLAKRGPREEWSVEITLTTPDERQIKTCGVGAVALDVGWRVMGGEIRVASWAGTDGARGEVRLPEVLLSTFEKVEDLRSIRDDHLNLAKGELGKALAAMTNPPEWLTLATESLAQWRSAGRLAALALRWSKARFDGDAAAYEALEAWRARDHHLWAWEANTRLKSLRRRKEIYKTFAAALAQRYGTVVLEAFDLRKVAVRQPTETAKGENETARRSRQLAAVSEFRLVLEHAFRSRGGDAATENAVDTTRTCHVCKAVAKFDAAALVHHACASCGAVWDQDENAARNLLERWQRRARQEVKQAAVAKESKWVKAKRQKAEKLAREGSACEEVAE